MFKFKIIHYLSTLLLGLSSSMVFSEIYQWTDEKGRTHFGDRPPVTVNSTSISDQLNQINITNDLSSPEMMLRHEQTKEAERKKRQEAWQAQQKNKPSQLEKCKEAKRLLKVIQGRVVFVDENGKDMKRSEKTREKRAKKLASSIQKYCQ